MSPFRSARLPAVVLLVAAASGLVLANSAAGPAVQFAMDTELGIPGVFELSITHWIQDALLAVFFFVVAVELRHELTSGELDSPRTALRPAIAAAGGVLVPIAVYLALAAGSDAAAGWPIPTATDIAFALGVLAVFGRGLPAGVRVFLLALAILDDIVGIVFIAVLFTDDVNVVMLVLAAPTVAAFAVLSRRLGRGGHACLPVVAVLVVLAIASWWLVYESGVHPTIAGVALGLAMRPRPASRARHALEPWVNGVVLPAFAFSAALVVIPAVSPTALSPAFWGIVVALPLGKIVGIAGAGWLAFRFARGSAAAAPPLAFGDLLAAGALGGIGFTVSLLLSELAFAGRSALRDQATLGVLAGSAISLVLAAMLVSWRAWHHRRIAARTPTT